MSVILTASADALLSTFDAVQTRVTALASRIKSIFTGMGDIFTGSIFGDIGGKGLLKGFGEVFKTVKGGIMAGLGFGGEFVEDQIKLINKLFPLIKKADALNMPLEDFMGLTKQFEKLGIEGDVATMVLAKFTAKVNDLKQMGEGDNILTRDMLDNKTTREQLMTVLDFLGKIDNVNERMAAAKDLWGRQFIKMVPLIKMGREAIDEFIAKQKELGNVLSEQDAAAIVRAKLALPKLEHAFEGFKNRVLVAFLPMLETFSDFLSKAGGPIANFLKEVAAGMEVFFHFMSHVWQEIFEGIQRAVGALMEFAKETTGIGESWGDTREIVANMLVEVAALLGRLWGVAQHTFADMLDLLGKLGRGFAEVMDVASGLIDEVRDLIKTINSMWEDSKMRKGVNAMIDTMKEAVENLKAAMPEGWEKALEAMKAKAGVGEGEKETKADAVRKAMNSIEVMAKNIRNNVGNPEKIAREWAEEWRGGFFESIENAKKQAEAMDADRFKNRLKIEQAAYQGTPAALEGSKEAYSIITRWQVRGMTVQEKQLEVQKEQLNVQKGMKKALEELNLVRPPVDVAVF